MAKASFLERVANKVKRWFTGGSSKPKASAPKPRVRYNNPQARNQTVSSRTSNRGRVLIDVDDKKEEKRVADAFKAKTRETQDMTAAFKKQATPDPKIEAAKKSRAEMRKKLEAKKQERKEEKKSLSSLHEKTGHKYDVKSDKMNMGELLTNARIDPEARKQFVKHHPIQASTERGVANAVTGGAIDLAMKRGTKGKTKEAEEYYQAHKNKAAETAGEIAGSFAFFGGTAGMTDRLGEKVISKAAPRAAEKLAGTKLIQNAAKKSVTKAVEKGTVKGATKELIEQVGKDRAKKIVNALGTDVAQNLTTGAIYDINKASTEYEWGSPEWWRELGKSAAFNAAITGAVGAGSAFTGGKRLVSEAADRLAKEHAPSAARARGSVFGKAAQAERNLERGLVNEGTYGDIRRGILPPSEIEMNGTRDIRMPLRNIGNAERIEPPAVTRERFLRNAEANANMGGGSTRLENLIRIPRRSDARISAINSELDEISKTIDRNRRFASDEEMDALINRFDELMAERNALENGGADSLYRAGDVGNAEPVRTNRTRTVASTREGQGLRAADAPKSVNESQTVRKPSEIMRGYSSVGSQKKLSEAQARARMLVEAGDTRGAREEVARVVDDVVSNTKLVEPLDNTVKEIKSVLKNTPIAISDKTKVDAGYLSGGYNEFRKSNFGSLKLTKEGTAVDDLWLSLQERYGTTLFPDEIDNPSDQLQYLAELSKSTDTKHELLDDEAAYIKDELTNSLWESVNEGTEHAPWNMGDEEWQTMQAASRPTEAEELAELERVALQDGYIDDAVKTPLPTRKAAMNATANKPAKGTKPAAAKLKTTAKNEDVNQFAGIGDDVSDMGFNAESEKVYQAGKKVEAATDNADTGKSEFDKLKDEAYKQSGTGLSTDGKEGMTAGEARELIDSEWRTTQEHTKRGFSTIAVTGDKGFKGIAHDALKNGETVIDVYHDKENLAAGAQRVMSKADQEGGINQMIKDFNDYASNKLRLTENERRDQIYDCIAAVDFANANKDQPWSGDLFLAACRAGAEQTSGSGLSLHMWHKMAMSSPAHRAKAVREQILDMFNRSAGMRKALNKGKGDKIKIDELDDVLKKNPALQKVLEELDNMDAATSKDEVEKVASKALLHARKAMPMTVLDQLTQWRYVAMLSSPKTHVRNITSNIYSATLGQLRDAIASSTENKLMKGTGVYGKKFQEAVKAGKIDESNYRKSAGGLSWKAFSDAHTGTKSGFTLNRLNSKIEKAKLELEATAKTEKNAAKLKNLNDRIKNLEARQKEAQKAYDEAVAKINRGEAKKALESWNAMGKEKLVADAEKWERRQYNGTISKGAFKINDKLSNFIGNALETSDALSLERIYREKFDKVLTANDWSGLSKRAASGDKEAAAALKQLEEYASQEAAYTAALDTYRNYNALSSAMNKFVSDSLFNYDAPIYKKAAGAALHAVMPFTKVPVNLLKRGIDYSPIGLMTAKRNLTRAIESGNITEINRACEHLAEGKIGTGIVALGAGLGFADPDGDLITGRLHDTDYIDKKKKDAGYQNYAVTLGDHNFTLDWATPTAASLFTGVEFGRMLRHTFDQMASDNGLQFNFWKAFDAPLILASTTLEPTLQLGVFQGINDTLESVVKSDNYDDSGTNINPALKIVASIAGNYVNSQISPAILGQLSRSFSPYDYFVTGDTTAEYAFTQQLAKTPLANNFLGAKTNVWGQVKNEKKDAGDYVKAAAKNLLSPANINKITWDETDEWAKEFYEKTGYQGAFPKNNYDKAIEVGRIKGAHTLEMNKKEMAEYNVQRGRSGEDAMRDALNTVVYNRYDKDSKGHRTIAHADNISPEEREKIAKQFKGKGIKEVVDYIRKTPQFKKATVAEQRQILDAIYGASGGDDDQAKGAKRSAQRYIAEKNGISANEYDYYNETPRKIQENLQGAIDSGLITYDEAIDFTRNAGKTYYTTDERGEKGGTVVTRYNKKEMMEYLSKKGYSYEQAEALYNAYKQANAKEFNGIGFSRGGGYRRRGWRHYGHGGGGGSKAKALKQSNFKATKRTYKDTAASLKTSSSRSKGLSSAASTVKVEPPKVKFKKYDV